MNNLFILGFKCVFSVSVVTMVCYDCYIFALNLFVYCFDRMLCVVGLAILD